MSFKDISGSSKTFSAFLDCCIEKQVVPICCYVATANTQPRFVALFPQVKLLVSDNPCTIIINLG